MSKSFDYVTIAGMLLQAYLSTGTLVNHITWRGVSNTFPNQVAASMTFPLVNNANRVLLSSDFDFNSPLYLDEEHKLCPVLKNLPLEEFQT